MTSTETVWRRGRFDVGSGPSKLLFGCMYEDVQIEMRAFRPGGRIFCITSAGCTALKLALDHEIVAVDINEVQIAYARQRFAGAHAIAGSAERVMAFGRAFAPLVGWSLSRVHTFLNLDDPAKQSMYWHRYLDTRRFRAVFDGLLSAAALRAVYASPFLACLPRHIGMILRRRMERCFARHPNRTNPYAHALLLGDLSDEPSSPEARGIHLVHADAASYLERVPAGSFDGFTLSNILDGADVTYKCRLFAAVKHAATPDAVVVWRSFREGSDPLLTNHAAEDRAMLWGIVDVRSVAMV